MHKTHLFMALLGLSACGSSSDIYTVFVQGHLKGSDPNASMQIHNAAAMGAESQARAMGDLSHYTYLGVPVPPATQSDGFLAIDRWTSLPNLMQFYSDPALQTGFSALLSGPPTILVTSEPASGWTEWGKLDPAGQGDPLFLFLIQAKFSAAQLSDSQTAHNAVATMAKPQAMAGGDVAHLVYLNPQDATQFNAVDLWTNTAGAFNTYGNPQIQAAFGTVFSGPPTVTPYQHSNWYQY